MNTNKIIRVIIPQQVRVRKNEINKIALVEELRTCKKKSNLTNMQIANKLSQPITLVEHWFRKDNSFSPPSDEIWNELKILLNIDTDEFDKEIMEFEIRDGIYEKSNRVYDVNGIAPTLTSASAEFERFLIHE